MASAASRVRPSLPSCSYPRWVVRHEEDRIVGEDWLGTPDAAKYLGLTTRTLYRLIDAGLLPGLQDGPRHANQVSDLDTLIASSQIEPGSIGHLYTARDDLDDVG